MNAPLSRPLVIGLTGNIATGKSTVLAMLADLGATTIDADAVYHGLIGPGGPLTAAIAARFGAAVLAADGGIDRRTLGAMVFTDPDALADLDALTHPPVIADVIARLANVTTAVAVVDAVKLIESGLAAVCDRVWLVTCHEDQQITRLMSRNGFNREDAMRRIAAQPPLAPKLARADLIINNSGTVANTREQVERAWASLNLC